MTGYCISFIPRDPAGVPVRDLSTGQLLLHHLAAGRDLESAKKTARQVCHCHRTGATLSQGGRQLLWFIWVPSEKSVEEIEPGTLPEEAVRTARRRLAANAEAARLAGVNAHIHGHRRRGPWRGGRAG
jgi:hypothetical protein